MADFKTQAVFGQDAHTDMRGDKLVGKDQGDHHITLHEERVDDAKAEELIATWEPFNQRAVEFGTQQFDELREAGVLDELLVAASAARREDVTGAKFFTILRRLYDND